MKKIPICFATAAAIALAALLPQPASAGGGCVEGGYGLGWKGGRPYYYTPFGVYGGDCYQYRPSRPYNERLVYRHRGHRYR